MPYTQASTDRYQGYSQAVDTDENDLLGQTNTRWDGIQNHTQLYNTAQDESIHADNQQLNHETGEPDSVLLVRTTYQAEQAQPNAARRSAAHEDFVVVDPSLPAQPETYGLDFDAQPASDEDFVVVPTTDPGVGVSPFLATTDEDFVVVQDTADVDDAEELPEVDLTDYVESWTPIVPKIAALISHELWPQLRSYLESLPQFGDTNLEQVVNAVAEDVGVSTASTDGIGEGVTEGFAFYASLFDEMAQESELAEAAQIG